MFGDLSSAVIRDLWPYFFKMCLKQLRLKLKLKIFFENGRISNTLYLLNNLFYYLRNSGGRQIEMHIYNSFQNRKIQTFTNLLLFALS